MKSTPILLPMSEHDARRAFLDEGPEHGFKQFMVRAKAGSAAAQAVTAFIYLNSSFAGSDYLEESIALATQSATQRNPYGQWVLAWALLESANVFDGIQALMESAENGFSPAQFHLGSFLVNGVVFPKDLNNGFEFFRAAATSGHGAARRHLDMGYKLGVFGAARKVTTLISQPVLRPMRFIHWLLFAPKFGENDLVYLRALQVENSLRRSVGGEEIDNELADRLDRELERLRSR